MNFKSIFFLLTLFGSFVVSAQEAKYVPFVSVKGGVGRIFQTNDFIRGENAHQRVMNNYQSAALSMSWQTIGNKDWQHIHNFPLFGVAAYTAFLENSEEIGQPIAIHAFYKAPFFRRGKSSLLYKIGFGLAVNWDCYDLNENPYNITIGSKMTVYIEAGCEYNYLVANRWLLGVGGELSHFSNGAIRKPNKGLNMITPFASLGYLLQPMPKLERRFDFPRERHNEVFVALGGGVKRSDYSLYKYPDLKSEYQDVMYHVATLSLGYMHQYGNRGKYGAGFNVVYDDWLGSSIKVNANHEADRVAGNVNDRFMLGVFGAHEFCIDRLSILTQLGCYVLRKTDLDQEKPLINERVGLKYHLANDFFAGINIYAHNFSKADFIEFNVGRRFVWRKTKVQKD